eukprot:CAMPEP_0174965920 /NCGR_PEP_ID=MMETSP0004_2-20121128/6696_1 /TAXON_ID=420556 /ORGANISM="Ochromonas sp., Strain CCMP1393" /LENGTH=292 /DNA_ID=CAMNT_0016214795 /DNA_START=107 /DNA_END=985 /DNA_ORIENTATION=+
MPMSASTGKSEEPSTKQIPQSSAQSISNKLKTVINSVAVLTGGVVGSSLAVGANATPQPEITDRVFINIKIANYTEESVGKNKGASGSGRVVIGLYGKAAPKSCQIFLDTILSDGVTSGVPSYVNSQLSKVTPEGLLVVEKVRGLEIVQIAGTDQYEYGGNLLNYQPILENNGIKHSRSGLLSRKQLTSGPEFGITLRPSEELDAFHVVFGTVLEGAEVLEALSKIPTYTYTTKTGYGGQDKGLESGLADTWFEGQKKLYVGAGRAFGDLRAIDRRGQLLRRVTIRQTGKVQ